LDYIKSIFGIRWYNYSTNTTPLFSKKETNRLLINTLLTNSPLTNTPLINTPLTNTPLTNTLLTNTLLNHYCPCPKEKPILPSKVYKFSVLITSI
jgi:hypothetical protein